MSALANSMDTGTNSNLEGENKQPQMSMPESGNMTLSAEEFAMNDFKMNEVFNVPSNTSSPSMLSRNDYQMLDPMKPYIKEEPNEVASCSQLSPLSPTSSGLGSSLQSQSPQNHMANYFASLSGPQQSPNIMYTINNNGDPILSAASLNIKNEAFSPQSMDICN